MFKLFYYGLVDLRTEQCATITSIIKMFFRQKQDWVQSIIQFNTQKDRSDLNMCYEWFVWQLWPKWVLFRQIEWIESIVPTPVPMIRSYRTYIDCGNCVLPYDWYLRRSSTHQFQVISIFQIRYVQKFVLMNHITFTIYDKVPVSPRSKCIW